MSLRAIKKRENGNSNASLNNIRPTVYRKSCKNKILQNYSTAESYKTSYREDTVSSKDSNKLYAQYQLLGRKTRSDPEFIQYSYATLRQQLEVVRLMRSKSDSDVFKYGAHHKQQQQLRTLINAKSEVCLKTIKSHHYQGQVSDTINTVPTLRKAPSTFYRNMLSIARSHRDLTQSYCPASANRRRMSEGASYPSQALRCNSFSTTSSDVTLSSDPSLTTHHHHHHHHNSHHPVDPNSKALRIPIIGYEVMEERARFTVYKLRVENPDSSDCWLVLRRYTDFVRLNNKLKLLYPHYNALNLPRKKFFGDNFKADFLDQRVQGLQVFVNTIMSNDELRKSQLVREFFCLDEPPTYSESMEECRAIFEAQEETIANLKVQLTEKNDLIFELQQKLTEAIQERETFKGLVK